MKTRNALRLKPGADYKESQRADYFSGWMDRTRDKASTAKCWHSAFAAECARGQ